MICALAASSWLPQAPPAGSSRSRRAVSTRSRPVRLVATDQAPAIGQHPSTAGELANLAKELLALQATPLALAQLTDAIVVSPSPFNADLFSNRDLHVVNATLIPLGIDKAIGKSQHQKVLHRLFAQVVIDSVDILVIEKLSECFIDLSRRIEALANRLF